MRPEIVFAGSAKEPYIIIDKPAGMPSAPQNETDKGCSAVSWLSDQIPEIMSVQGLRPHEHGLIHRLDTATRGLLLIARTQEAFDAFIQIQQNGLFIKKYTAYSAFCPSEQSLPGFPPAPLCLSAENISSLSLPYDIQSQFRAFGQKRKQVRPVTSCSGMAALKKSGKILYTTQLLSVCKTDRGWKTLCRITRGFRHQVRCHLAWIGLPVMGDAVYNMNYSGTENSCDMQFFASELEFPHPITGEKRIWKISPDAI